jgi:hypothetical protein
MENPPRARIVRLDAAARAKTERRAAAANAPAHPTAGPDGAVVRLWAERDLDAWRNHAWNRLLMLAEHAWTWRDPESLEEFEDCLLRLSLTVESDWS